MSDRPLFATSMRGFGVHFHGYNNKHYKEDVRKYLFWINSLGGSVVPKVDSHKKKVSMTREYDILFCYKRKGILIHGKLSL